MADHLWTTLWAHELEPDEVPAGTIATFVKAPRRAGEYGFVDALIAGLDRCPLTHAGMVTTGSVEGPHLVHSTMAGLRHEPLGRAVPDHRRAPVFLFRHARASAATIGAVVGHAVERAESADARRDAYPMGDLLLAAVLLRLRNGSRFDEHAHHRLAGLLGTVVDPDLTGRMCAAFVSEVFAATGSTLARPDERTAFTMGIVESYAGAPAMPSWAVDLLGDGLADIARAAADGAARAELDHVVRAEVVDVFRHLAADPATSRELATWVLGVPQADEAPPPTIARLVHALGDSSPDRPVGGDGPVRFSTVNDLVRSPDLVPLGHVIGWADEPVPA